MIVGYAKDINNVSLDNQVKALLDYGCKEVFSDKYDNQNTAFNNLSKALNFCDQGDIFVCFRLDCLGDNYKELLDNIDDISQRKIIFISLEEKIDTRIDNKFFENMAKLLDFERNKKSEKTKLGLMSAKNRGVRLGRPDKINLDLVTRARDLVNKNLSVTEVCRSLGISRTSFYKKISPQLFS